MTEPASLPSLAHAELTREIIGAAIHVHKTLGPGFIESAYHNALCLTLDKQGIPFAKELDVPVVFEGVEVASHRLDLLVADLIVVELKVCRAIDIRHLAVMKSYLRAVNLEFGLVFNFAAAPLEIRRVINRDYLPEG